MDFMHILYELRCCPLTSCDNLNEKLMLNCVLKWLNAYLLKFIYKLTKYIQNKCYNCHRPPTVKPDSILPRLTMSFRLFVSYSTNNELLTLAIEAHWHQPCVLEAEQHTFLYFCTFYCHFLTNKYYCIVLARNYRALSCDFIRSFVTTGSRLIPTLPFLNKLTL